MIKYKIGLQNKKGKFIDYYNQVPYFKTKQLAENYCEKLNKENKTLDSEYVVIVFHEIEEID